jgi:protein TonB
MAENRSLFYISGFISISLFAFFASLFIYMMFSSNKINQFALTKDNYISISMDMPKIETKSTKKSVVTPPVKEIVKPTVKAPNIDLDVGNLFDNVWTKDIKKVEEIKRKTDNRIIQEIQKKISTSKINEVSDKPKEVENNDKTAASDTEAHKSTSNEINEYLAKIQGLVYRYFNPPPNSQGNSVRAVIKLSAIGKVLDFRILNYSANSSLNDECDLVKDRLMSVVFPINPQNKSGNYIIILTSKE